MALNNLKIDFSKMSDDELRWTRVLIDKELKRRQIKFSTGDLGEAIAIAHFNKTPKLSNLLRANVGTQNVDALSRKGERYSIKTIKDGSKTGTVYPDPADRKRMLFEYLVLVILNEEYALDKLYRFSWEQFTAVRKWDKTMNAWYVPKTKKALAVGECIFQQTNDKND